MYLRKWGLRNLIASALCIRLLATEQAAYFPLAILITSLLMKYDKDGSYPFNIIIIATNHMIVSVYLPILQAISDALSKVYDKNQDCLLAGGCPVLRTEDGGERRISLCHHVSKNCCKRGHSPGRTADTDRRRLCEPRATS